MKKYLEINCDEHNLEKAARLLRKHGFDVAATGSAGSPRQSEQLSPAEYRDFIESAPIGVFRSTLDGKLISVNPAMARILKYDSPADLMETVNRSSFAEALYVEKGRRREVVEDLLHKEGWQLNEVQYRCKDDSIITCNYYIRKVRGPDGVVTELEGFVEDITDRKQAEAVLRKNLTLHQTMVRNAPVILYGFDRNGVFTLSEGKGLAGMGLKPGEIVGRSLFDIYRDHPEALGHLKRALDGEAFAATLHFGDHVLDAYHEPVFGEDGEYAGTFGVVVDVTERTQAEESLREANLVVENSPVILFRRRADKGWPVEMVSRNIIQFGYTPEELLSGKVPFSSMVHPDDLERVAAEVSEYSASGVDSFEQEYRIVAKQGDVRWIYDRTVIERDAAGKISHFQGIVIDITERKQAETALQESEEKYRAVADFTYDWETWIDPDGKLVYISPSCQWITGYSADDFMNEPELMTKIVHTDDRATVEDHYRGAIKDDAAIHHIDFRIATKSGEERWIEHICQPVFSSYGKFLGRRASNRDSTERTRAEEMINASLAEKEVLLKEVHHRVKNNMQIISTLLDLQSENIGDKEALNAFRESQDRIKAMALVHEKLYESEDLASVDIAKYIEDLSAHLFGTYLVDSGRVALKVECGDISIGVDQAIPCGLIINELVSNALKHAFPDKRPGEIFISLDRNEGGRITLRVADNGVGMPPDFDWEQSESLGLQLVNMLVRQLFGTLEVDAGQGGAAFIIGFPLSNPAGKSSHGTGHGES